MNHVRIHYEPAGDDAMLEFHEAANLDLDVHDRLELWFDRDRPGRLVALRAIGATTVWNTFQRDELRGLLGDQLTDQLDQLARTYQAATHTTDEPATDPERDHYRLLAHRRYRIRIGDPLPTTQPTPQPLWRRWLRPARLSHALTQTTLRSTTTGDEPSSAPPSAASAQHGTAQLDTVQLDPETANALGLYSLQLTRTSPTTLLIAADERSDAPTGLTIEASIEANPSLSVVLDRDTTGLAPAHTGTLELPAGADHIPTVLFRADTSKG